MRLTLTRTEQWPKATIGELYIENVIECYTVEDVARPDGIKVPGATAIPTGTYPVQITWSPRFQVDMPLLVGVPGFSGIRIHTGNTSDHTEGCVVVGTMKYRDTVMQSRAAYDRLFDKLRAALDDGQSILIDVVNAWRA